MIIGYTVPEIWHVTDVLLFFILGYTFPFYPHNSPKNENFKKMKKGLEISSFYTSVPKIMIIYYTVPEIWYVTHVIVIFIFAYFLLFYPPNSPKNKNFKKMNRAPGDTITLYMCTKNYD